MRINQHNVWLGDEESLLQATQEELKILETPNADLQEMSIRSQTEFLDVSEEEFGQSAYMVSRADNLALVTISGSLTSKNRPYNRHIGMVSYDEIRDAVFAAMSADGIDGIVLNMDTPGGQASGVSELSDFLTEVDESHMPIFTYAGTTMASGGYWLGSIGREIYASKLATVGSIGVITVHASYKDMYKKEGIDITVLRAGEFKALGSPYEKLDDKARAQIEGQMNKIYDMFLTTVSDQRGMSVPLLKETAAEGRVFIGEEAVEVGLVDHITSFDAAIEAISKKVKSSNSRSSKPSQPSVNITGEIDMPGKKKVLTEAGKAALESGAPKEELLENPEMFELVDDAPEADDQSASAEEGEETAGDGTDAEANAETEEAETEETEEAAPAASASEPASEVGALITKLADQAAELGELRAKVSAAEARCDEMQGHESALVKIAAAATNRMQVALGAAPMKLEGVAASAVIDQYNRTYSQFNSKFKVGSTAEVPQNEDTSGQVQGSNSALDAAAARLTGGKM